MPIKSKLAMIATIAALGVATALGAASPAFAQDLETGTAADTFGYNSPQANAVGPVGIGRGLYDFTIMGQRTRHLRR